MTSKEQSQRTSRDIAGGKPKLQIPAVGVHSQHESPLQVLVQRAMLDPRSLSPKDVSQLQRISGNQAVTQLLSGAASRPNQTGLPDRLKTGMENLSGLSLDEVKVHYNSEKPAQLNALAYAQGSDIHVAPGQEQHLPHEAWHVVQQAQGRVKPTLQLKGGVPVNDDKGLEREADVMGTRSLTYTAGLVPDSLTRRTLGQQSDGMPPLQRLTADPPPPAHKEGLHHIEEHALAEIVTNTWGVEEGSDTSGFEHTGNSSSLDRLEVKYNGTVIGDIVTIGSDANTIVKMHLVNSYLHPNANNWGKNWVWGSQTLNKNHSTVEEKAKAVHPKNDAANISLNYETKASASRPKADATAETISDSVKAAFAKTAKGFVGVVLPENIEGNILVNGQTLDVFIPQWASGVGQATTQVNVAYRVAKAGGKWEKTINDKASIPDDTYTIYFIPNTVNLSALISGWIPPNAPREKRKVPASKPKVASPQKESFKKQKK